MSKNLKIWKGLAVLFALVLVVGGGILLKFHADAVGTTVVYYVSENGDDSTGEDEATAYTSILKATTAANALALPAGSEVKIIVVDRVICDTRNMDVAVTGADGKPIHVTITSYQDSADPADFSEIYCTYLWTDSKGLPYAYPYISVSGWTTFRNIRIDSMVYEGYFPANATSSTLPYCVRTLYLNGDTEMDNVDFTNDWLSGGISTKIKWRIHCANSAAETLEKTPYKKKYMHFHDCNFEGKVDFMYVNSVNVPGYDITADFENFIYSGHLYISSGHARKIEVNIKDGTKINDIYLGSGKDRVITEGITINYLPGSTVGVLAGSDGNDAIWEMDITQNFYGDIGYYGSPYNSRLGPSCLLKGNLTNNFYPGCRFQKPFYCAGTTHGATGVVTNNFYGGTFDGIVYMGTQTTTSSSKPGAKVINRLVNNVYDGTFKNVIYGSSLTDPVGEMETNVYGGDFASAFYCGNRRNPVERDVNVRVAGGTFRSPSNYAFLGNGDYSVSSIGGNLNIEVSGGSWARNVVVGCGFGNVGGSVNVLISGGTFNGYIYGSYGNSQTEVSKQTTIGGDMNFKVTNVDYCKDIIRILSKVGTVGGDVDVIFDTTDSPSNSIIFPGFQGSYGKNGVNGEARVYVDGGPDKNITISADYFGCISKVRTVNQIKNCTIKYFSGIRDTGTADVENVLENVTLTGGFYGTTRFSVTAPAGNVVNQLTNCTTPLFYGIGATTADTSPCQSITNILTDCKTTGNLFGGGNTATTIGGDVKNYFTRVEMIGINYGGSLVDATIEGSIYNYITDSSSSNIFAGGGNRGTVKGNVYNYFTDFDLPGGLIAGLRTAGTIQGDIITVIDGGTICRTTAGNVNGGTSVATTVKGDISLTIEDGIFNNVVSAAVVKDYEGTVSLVINGGTFATTVSSIKVQNTAKDVNFSIRGGTFNGEIHPVVRYDDTYDPAVKGNVVTSISGGTFKNIVFGVGHDAIEHDGSTTVTISGGSFAEDFIGTKVKRPAAPQLEQNFTMNIHGGTFAKFLYGIYGTSIAGDVNFTMTNAKVKNFVRVLRSVDEVGGDLTIVLDTTDLDSNKIELEEGFESTFPTSVINGTSSLYVDGGADRNVTIGTYFNAAPGNVKTVNTVKNANLGNFGAFRTNTAANEIPLIINTFENVILSGNFTGASTPTVSGLKNYVNRVENTFTDCVIGGNWFGGLYSNLNSASYCKEIKNVIVNSTFNGTFYGGDKFDTTPSAVETVIYGGTFNGAVYVNDASAHTETATLKLVPEKGPIFLSSVVAPKTSSETISLEGAANPIRLDADASLTLSAYDGAEQIFQQTQGWTVDTVYVQFPNTSDLSLVKAFNLDDSVTGTGVVDTGAFALKGSATAAGAVTAPALTSVSFHLADTLGVRFWIPKADVQAYINAFGSWSYEVQFKGNLVDGKTFTAMSQFAAEDMRNIGSTEYVTFLSGLKLTSVEYGETFSVSVSGNAPSLYTAYELLDLGVAAYNTYDPEFATLFRAMYNYGAEAYNVFRDGAIAVKYENEVPAPGTYTGSATATSSQGYNFYATSMTMAEEVTLNFYFNAPGKSASDLIFTAQNSLGVNMDAAKISVREVAGSDAYNMIVSLRLTIPEMAEVYTVKVSDGTGEVATCTNSIPYACMTYINDPSSKFGRVSKALLSVIEISQAYLNA